MIAGGGGAAGDSEEQPDGEEQGGCEEGDGIGHDLFFSWIIALVA